MKISIIEPVGGYGGLDYYDSSLCSSLVQNGINPILFTSDETEIRDHSLYLTKKYFIGIYGTQYRVMRGLKYIQCLLKSIYYSKKVGSQLIHYHFFHFTFIELLTIILTKLYGFKIVITVHDVKSFYGKGDNPIIKNIILKSALGLIVHNQFSKGRMINTFHVTQNKISIIPHGHYIDMVNNNIDNEIAKRSLKLNINNKYILFFGQIKKVKGLEILLYAMSNIVEMFDNVKLIIAGRVWKDDYTKYEYLIKELNLQSHVISHIRYIKNEEVDYYFKASDIVVLPYSEIYQSGVLLMAMSYKKPVIVSNIPGMTELISHGKNGLIFNNGDNSELSNCIAQLLSNKDLSEKLANEGYKTVRDDCCWTRIGINTSKFYRNLVLI